jgi:hypothetical protein
MQFACGARILRVIQVRDARATSGNCITKHQLSKIEQTLLEGRTYSLQHLEIETKMNGTESSSDSVIARNECRAGTPANSNSPIAIRCWESCIVAGSPESDLKIRR